MKTVKTNDCITVTELLKVNKWNPDLIRSHLGNPIHMHSLGGEGAFRRSFVVKMENYLTKMKIEWRAKE